MYEITPPLLPIQPNENPIQCTSDIDANFYESMLTDKVHSVISKKLDLAHQDQCANQSVSRETNTILSNFNYENERLAKLGNKIDEDWDRLDKFNPIWLDQMDSNKMPVLAIKKSIEIKKWFQYSRIPIPRYWCWLCLKYGNELGMGYQYRNDLVSEEGQEVLSDKKKNYGLIEFHHKSKYHRTIVQKLIEKKSKTLHNVFIEAQNKKETANPVYQATAKMFRTVYGAIRMNLPFGSFGRLVELQKANGVELGSFFANDKGASKLMGVIYERMREILIEYLKKNEKPLSLLIDTSTAGKQFMSVLIQTLENDRPVVYFYDLIELNSETGLSMYSALYNKFQKDNLIDCFKNNLYAVSTDGASSMTGKKNRSCCIS